MLTPSQQFVWYTLAETSIGRLLVAATHRGVCCVGLGDCDTALIATMQQTCPHSTFVHACVGENDQLATWVSHLVAYCQGQQDQLPIPLDITGTPFQHTVWAALQTIPYGETRSYAAIAHMLNKPHAARAVGAACGANPVPLIVPCHRVIASDGKLGGYSSGVQRKKTLLEIERQYKSRYPSSS